MKTATTVSGEEITVGRRFVNITSAVFGRLTVIGLHHMNKKKGAWWLCTCECGATCCVRGSHLRSGNTSSCGCLQKDVVSLAKTTHGMRNHPAYPAWRQLRQRCNNPKTKGYKDYGGRGITCCKEWETFSGFWSDMGSTWREGLSIDRVDVNGNYCPENCKWSTLVEQSRNKRKNKNNTSGVTGVYYISDSGGRWVAEWRTLDGLSKTKSFSISKYGEDSFKLACQHRSMVISILNEAGAGYSDNHGK